MKRKIWVPVSFSQPLLHVPIPWRRFSSGFAFIAGPMPDGRFLAPSLGASSSVEVVLLQLRSGRHRISSLRPRLKSIISYRQRTTTSMQLFSVSQVSQVSDSSRHPGCHRADSRLLLSLLNGHQADHQFRERESPAAWRALREISDRAGAVEGGRLLGIIGVGQIGSRVARIANGFDMKVMSYDRFVHPQVELGSSPLEEGCSPRRGRRTDPPPSLNTQD